MRKIFLALTVIFAAVFMIAAPASAQSVGWGEIYVYSNVYGADVYIDGVYMGSTPGYFDVPVTQYSHLLEVEESGYYSYEEYVYEGEEIYAYLTPVSTPSQSKYGHLTVTSSPSGADVTVDGNYVGSTPLTGSYAVGTHTVGVSIAGYPAYYENVNIYSGSTANVYATFSAPKPVYSTLTLSTTPSGASAYVDNVFRGLTTLTLTDITPGYHTISTTLNGYSSWSESIYFSDNTKVDKSVVLSATPAPTPTKSPMPFIALIAGLGAAAFFALRRE